MCECCCRCRCIIHLCLQVSAEQAVCRVRWGAVDRWPTDLCWFSRTGDFPCFGWADSLTFLCMYVQHELLPAWLNNHLHYGSISEQMLLLDLIKNHWTLIWWLWSNVTSVQRDGVDQQQCADCSAQCRTIRWSRNFHLTPANDETLQVCFPQQLQMQLCLQSVFHLKSCFTGS